MKNFSVLWFTKCSYIIICFIFSSCTCHSLTLLQTGVEKDGVRVLFLDFGNDHVVPVVYPLHPELCMTQVQAIHCSLFNILPLDGGDKWSEEVADFFNDYVGERVFRMTVRNVGRESMARGGSFKNPLVVEMTERGKDKTLGDVLVTLKMARFVWLFSCDTIN